MAKYRVMLVDDEEEVIQAIIRKLEWETIGFEVAGYATNGEDALEVLEMLTPDVIVTDIKMPFMDGLTLCKKVKEKYPHIRVIILSGFDEFEYAREAIKAEAEEYILKPINAKELEELFIKLRQLIDKEHTEKRDIEKLRDYYLKSLPIMQEQCMASLVEGKIIKEQIDNYLEMYQLTLQSEYFIVTAIHIDYKKSDIRQYSPLEEQLMAVSLKQYIDEKMKKHWECKSFIYLGKVVLIVMLKKEEEMNPFIDYMDRVCKMTENVLGISILAGIGQVVKEIAQLPHSYENANMVMAYRVFHGGSRAIPIHEIQPSIHEIPIIDMENVQTIVRQIKVGEEAPLEDAIQTFMDVLKTSKFTYQQFSILSMEVITELYKLGVAYGLKMQQIFGGNYTSFSSVEKIDTVEKLENILKEACLTIRSYIRKERKDNTRLLIENAKNYMLDNYNHTECTIESLCEYLNISSCYFSTLFKKETGTTLINYLTDVRMEKAKELLRSTEEKTYVIAEQVGYSEPNYFSYVFKKRFKVSPSVYRTDGEL